MRGEQPWRTNRARVLRSNATNAERKLWQQLRAERLGGYKFKRQDGIGPYFVDFVCHRMRIIVEVDGGTHATQAQLRNDEERCSYLESQGYRVVRVRNLEIFENIDGVCATLLRYLQVVAGQSNAVDPPGVTLQCEPGGMRGAAPLPGPLPANGERE